MADSDLITVHLEFPVDDPGFMQGKPTLLTKGLCDQISQTIASGGLKTWAAALAGVSEASMMDWTMKGNREKNRVRMVAVRMEKEEKAKNSHMGIDELDQHVANWRAGIDWGGMMHDNRKLHVYFADLMARAEATAKMSSLIRIRQAGAGSQAEFLKDEEGDLVKDDKGKPILLKKEVPPNWFADAWFLERTDPDNFSQKSRQQTGGGGDGAPLSMDADLNDRRAADKELREWEKQEGLIEEADFEVIDGDD